MKNKSMIITYSNLRHLLKRAGAYSQASTKCKNYFSKYFDDIHAFRDLLHSRCDILSHRSLCTFRKVSGDETFELGCNFIDWLGFLLSNFHDCSD